MIFAEPELVTRNGELDEAVSLSKVDAVALPAKTLRELEVATAHLV